MRDADGSGDYGFSIVELTATQVTPVISDYAFKPIKVHDAWTSNGANWT